MLRRMVTRRMCLPWVTVPHGQIGELRNQPLHPPYNRCLRWPVGWDTRCARSPDSPMPQDSRRAIDRSLIKTGDSVLRHGPVRTTPGSSASAADNSDICRPVVRDRTLHYHLSQRVGTFTPTVVNSGMAITNQETPHRPGPHPHRSVRTSFDPHFIFMHQIVFTLFTTGHCDHLYLSTIHFMYRNMRIICGSGSYGVTGGVFTRRYGWDISVPYGSSVCTTGPESTAASQLIGRAQWMISSRKRLSCRYQEQVIGSWRDGLAIIPWIF